MKCRLLSCLVFTVVFCLCNDIVLAQVQPIKKSVIKSVPKFKPPVVKTYLAAFSGIKAECTAEEGKQIITLPIVIKDDKGVTYTISSYQFAYKRWGVTEDEESGKTSPVSDMVGQRFTENPLPAIWQSNIIEQLHKAEELYFFDIIVLDKKNRLFFAPDLKITIQ